MPTGAVKTPFHNYAVPMPDLGGDGVTARGTDPNVSAEGDGGLQELWPNPIVPTPANAETANSVSGLPAQPQRFEPSETPPDPPSLDQRNPGTIDKR